VAGATALVAAAGPAAAVPATQTTPQPRLQTQTATQPQTQAHTLGADATISGTVSDATGTGLGNVCVEATDNAGSAAAPGATTDASGAYSIAVPAGTYKLEAWDCNGFVIRFLDTWFGEVDGVQYAAVARKVTVVSGATASGIDTRGRQGGTIAGTVTGPGGAPLADMCVDAVNGPGYAWTEGFTDNDGTYSTDPLPPGTYQMRVYDCGDEIYVPATGSSAPATTVTVAADAVSLFDASMVLGGTISGVATDAVGAPIPDICVDAYDGNGTWVDGGYTDATGYSLSGMPAGAYALQFTDCSGQDLGSQWSGGQPDRLAATPVTVVAGATTSGIDAVMVAGGTVSGVVTDGTAQPIQGVCVSAYDEAGDKQAHARTDASGAYGINGLGAGSYRVVFEDCATGTHAYAWAGDASTRSASSVVPVVSNAATMVDAQLGAAATISGGITDADHDPVAFTCVSVYDTAGDEVGRQTWTDAAGAYSFGGLRTGQYRVRADADCEPYPIDPGARDESYGWATAWSGGADDLASAAPLATTAGTVTTYDVTLGLIVPAAPAGVAATAGNGSASVTWTAPDPGTSPVTGSTVTASPGGASVHVSGSATSATVAGLTNGLAYTFTVRSENVNGPGLVSLPSTTVTPLAPAAPPPPAPSPPPTVTPTVPPPPVVTPPDASPPAVAPPAAPAPAAGYRLVAADGGIFGFGNDGFFGSTGAVKLASPIVGAAPTPTGKGYWLVASDGGIFAFGDAGFFGSTGAMSLNRPIVAMAATPTGKGYWLVASDGGIFAFGDARFFGSTGAMRLVSPIVSAAATPTGAGYWLIASDGGIFAFGDARFFGSTGATALRSPITSMAPTPSGKGYWLVAGDGGIFAFGDATFFGSIGSASLNKPIVAITS
jgi:hypothetical protein